MSGPWGTCSLCLICVCIWLHSHTPICVRHGVLYTFTHVYMLKLCHTHTHSLTHTYTYSSCIRVSVHANMSKAWGSLSIPSHTPCIWTAHMQELCHTDTLSHTHSACIRASVRYLCKSHVIYVSTCTEIWCMDIRRDDVCIYKIWCGEMMYVCTER